MFIESSRLFNKSYQIHKTIIYIIFMKRKGSMGKITKRLVPGIIALLTMTVVASAFSSILIDDFRN